MKVVLLFDDDKLDNVYRIYTVNDNLRKNLADGGQVSITVMHPKYGEVFWAQNSVYFGEGIENAE